MRIWFVQLFSLLFFIGCHNTTETVGEPSLQLIYANSFESHNDTVGWNGFGSWSIYKEAAPHGGLHSLSVKGIDVLPHATNILQAPTENSLIIFRFWARCLVHGGVGNVELISLAPVESTLTAGSGVHETVWRPYSDTASFPAGYNLVIWINGDAGLETPILVDRIEILKIVK